MEKVKRFLNQYKMPALLAVFLVVVFVGFSIMSAINVSRQRESDASQGQQEQAAQTEEDTTPTQTTLDVDENADEEDTDSNLTAAQQALIDDYDYKTKDLIDTLCAGVWTSGGGRYTLHFYDTYYIETMNGNEETHYYAISAVEYGTNGSDTEIDTIVFETDIGTHIVTFSLVKSAESEYAGQATVESASMFSSAETVYERADAVLELDITGLNKEMEALLGDLDKLNKEMSAWCSVHYPTVTTAVWSENVTIDFGQDLIVTSFTLGTGESAATNLTGNTSMVISVTYDRTADTYEFGL